MATSLRRAVVIAAFVLALPAVAGAAAPLVTAVLPNGVSDSISYQCIATNIGAKDAEVTIEFVNGFSGAVFGTTAPATTVPPGQSITLVLPVSASAFCRVTGLTAKNGKAVFFLIGSSDQVLMTLTAP